MKTCARCRGHFVDNRSFTVRMKDGSEAKICVNCASELRAMRSQKRHTSAAKEKSVPVPTPVSVEKKAKNSENKWYKTIGVGIVCILFAGYIY